MSGGGAFDYIRTTYGVPAAKGVRVEYTGDGIGLRHGTVVGVDGAHILIRLDGERHAFPYHPTWELRYIEREQTP